MFYLDDNMCREIILDHIKNPRNKNKNHDNYQNFTLKNPSCGDIVTVYMDIDKDKVKDITYDVSGCSICTSSTSIMSDLLKDKAKTEINVIMDNFNKMLIGESYEEDILKEAASLRGVHNSQPRIKCASLCYKAVDKIIKGENHE